MKFVNDFSIYSYINNFTTMDFERFITGYFNGSSIRFISMAMIIDHHSVNRHMKPILDSLPAFEGRN
ncbi:MAG: hypothetical protein OXC92_03170 [Flavobacteriaceae bacterium]|nr:hypothetical protein [Flavobacteriaceae bacterium]MCY4215971.1 hypothetical protein [Flavobacteriaceae bacterium]